MMRLRPSIYHGSTLREVQAEARRRHDERLMVEILSGLFYAQGDAQINGGSRCMSVPLSSVVEVDPSRAAVQPSSSGHGTTWNKLDAAE